MVYKTNPKVLFQQQIVSNPSRQNLNPNNFSFVMALLDSNFNPISDPSVFRFVGNFVYKESVINPDGSAGQSVFKNKEMEIEICHENSFQVQGTQSYFWNLQYQQMYCFKNIEDFYLVGQFEMDEYSAIQINVAVCDEADPKNNVKCMEQTQKNKILSTSILQLYYINQLVQLSNKNEPFKPMGQTQFWETNIDFLQNINLIFVKTYVEDDDSLILSNSNIKSELLFSNDRTMLQTVYNYSIYQVNLFLQKNQEQHYYRQYLKISDAFSQIGGIFNVLFVIGCLIAQPYSQLQFNRKLFNATFDISKSNKQKIQEDNKNSKYSDNSNSSGDEFINFPSKDQIKEIQNSQKQLPCSQWKKKERKKQNSKQQDEQNQHKTKINRKLKQRFSVFQINDDFQKQQQNQSFKQYVKGQFQKISVKTSEFLCYYLNCFKLFKSDLFEMVSFGTSQILGYTDICFVVNKLIELEKLKAIILNEQQIKLFDFIPKPKIDIEIVKEFKSKIMKKKVDDDIQNQDNNSNNTNQQESNSSVGKKQFNILTIQNRTIYEKAKQAQQAFNEIYNNQTQKSDLDLKLISMLDKNLTQLFQTNTFNDDNLSMLKSSFYNQRQIVSPQLLNNIEKFSIQQNQFKNQKSKTFILCPQSSYEQTQILEQKNDVLSDSQTSENNEGIFIYKNKPKYFKSYAERKNISPSDNQIVNKSIINSQILRNEYNK
ncbi:hypothetical protein ABPG74_016189 [Tetrahymena malaccensis]